MKLIVRIDDIGYTDINNMGSFLAIEEGIATAADVMLDTPGTIDALKRLREYPWISVGWHTHFYGSPVLPREKVPTLVQENGHFKSDIYHREDVDYDESYAELEAEVRLCLKYLGHAPEYIATIGGEGTFTKAINAVCDKYGIVRNFMTGIIDKKFMPELPEEKRTQPAAAEWEDRGILCPPVPFVDPIFSNDLFEILKYGDAAKKYYMEDPDGWFTRTDYKAIVTVWHPGYVDRYVVNEGEPGDFARNFDHVRYQDINVLCADDVKQWIVDKKLELASFTDAMYGKRDYQNHLLEIGSPMAIQ